MVGLASEETGEGSLGAAIVFPLLDLGQTAQFAEGLGEAECGVEGSGAGEGACVEVDLGAFEAGH